MDALAASRGGGVLTGGFFVRQAVYAYPCTVCKIRTEVFPYVETSYSILIDRLKGRVPMLFPGTELADATTTKASRWSGCQQCSYSLKQNCWVKMRYRWVRVKGSFSCRPSCPSSFVYRYFLEFAG